MHVGVEADLFDFRRLVAGQGVVEVFGDGVGVRLGPGPGGRRHRQPAAAGDLFDALDELLGGIALGHLLADRLGFVGVKRVVEIGEKSPQRKTHGVLRFTW
jgi:hypothetical protein